MEHFVPAGFLVFVAIGSIATIVHLVYRSLTERRWWEGVKPPPDPWEGKSDQELIRTFRGYSEPQL